MTLLQKTKQNNRKKELYLVSCACEVEREGSGVQGQPQLHSQFEAMIPCLKTSQHLKISLLSLKNLLALNYLFVYACRHVCHSLCVEVREKFSGAGSLSFTFIFETGSLYVTLFFLSAGNKGLP